MFNEKFGKNAAKFTFDSKGLPFVKLSEYAAENGTDAVITVKAMFTHNKSEYGEKGVIVCERCCIDVPSQLIEDIKTVRADADMVKAVNDGKCGFKIYSYTDKNGKTRYSGTFVDI